jgi:hypothetical protein
MPFRWKVIGVPDEKKKIEIVTEKTAAEKTGEAVGKGIRKSAKAVNDFGKGMKKGLNARANLLNNVPFEYGFQFFTERGKNTGVTATSMVEFAEKLQIVPIQSVTFHFQRQDFQKWFKNTVGDEELAKRIDQIKAFQDEDLRKELSETVQNRIAELQRHL